jgi:tRNA A-37 threonylcarbamoyl transferase component Bud32
MTNDESDRGVSQTESRTPWDGVLRVALALVDAARGGFLEWDRQRQTNIAERATSRDEGMKALTKHRERTKRLVQYFVRAYSLVGIAADVDPVASLAGIERLANATDRFLLANRLGSGNDGEVWEASDRKLHRNVAVKFLHERAADEALLVHARNLVRGSHPNVVAVFDVATVRHPETKLPVRALVMEYVPETLENRLRRVISRVDVRELGFGLLDGLAALHCKDVYHRDLSSRNMLVAGALLKLIDPRMSGESAETPAATAAGARGKDLVAAQNILADMLMSSEHAPSVSVCMREMFAGRAPSLAELRRAFDKLTSHIDT